MAKLALIRASLYVLCCVHSFCACVLMLFSADVMFLYQSCTPFWFVSLEREWESLQYSHYGDGRYFGTYSREASLYTNLVLSEDNIFQGLNNLNAISRDW